jgi:hypothetical protein
MPEVDRSKKMRFFGPGMRSKVAIVIGVVVALGATFYFRGNRSP